MRDYEDLFRDLRNAKREYRAKHGVPCPECKRLRPRGHPSILLPQQQCKVDGYRDPRPRGETYFAAIKAVKERAVPKVFEAPPGFVLNPDYLVPELRAQRDLLLEALKAGPSIEHTLPTGPCACSQCQFVRMRSAAIKAVEENT